MARPRTIQQMENKRQTSLRSRRKIKMEVLTHYCGGAPKCQCPGCNEADPAFLTIDHINGGGVQHRAEINKNWKLRLPGHGGGQSTYNWLKKNNFPPGFQVLCFNCNCGRQFNGGVCPHLKPTEYGDLTTDLRIVWNQAQRNKPRGRGTMLDKSRNRWRAVRHIDGRKRYFGRFQTEEEAHQAYIASFKEVEMSLSLVETVQRIRQAGASKVRAVPMSGQSVNGGMYQIEILEGSTWLAIAEGLPSTTANDLIRQATNRLICG